VSPAIIFTPSTQSTADLSASSQALVLDLDFEWELLQVEASLFLTYWIKNLRGFMTSIALKRLFPEYARKMFSEIPVRT
jgi:hypothetical protein